MHWTGLQLFVLLHTSSLYMKSTYKDYMGYFIDKRNVTSSVKTLRKRRALMHNYRTDKVYRTEFGEYVLQDSIYSEPTYNRIIFIRPTENTIDITKVINLR